MARTAAKAKPKRSARDDARTAYRESLLASAEQVFVSAGLRTAKMTDIAAAAGVAVGTLYNYFDSKEEMFQAILAERSATLRGELEPLLKLPDPMARIEGIVRHVCDHICKHGALFMLFVERDAATELDMERVGGLSMRIEYDRFLELLETAIQAAVASKALRRDVPVRTHVAMLSGGMNGAIYAWFKRKRRDPIQTVVDDLLKLYFAGASAQS